MNEAEKDEATKRAGVTAPLNEEPFDEETIDEELDQPMNEAEPLVEEVIAEEVTLSPERDVPTQAGDEDEGLPFWGDGQAEDFRSRWTDIQTGFVDDPRRSVEQADELLETTIRSLTDNFGNRRSALRGEWERSKDLSTEDLRVTMKRYRSFLEGLLALEP
jgi:hypothetical protein